MRFAAVALSLVLLTGCTNIMDKVTQKSQDTTQTALSTTNVNSTQGQVGTTTTTSQEISMQDLQAALKDGKTVKLVALDTGQNLALDQAQREALMKLMANAGELKETRELAQVVDNPQFPNYQIQIDQNIKMNIYDQLHFGWGDNAPNYYMEKGDIWRDLARWLPPIAYAENQTGYLFKASKLTVSGASFTKDTDKTPLCNAVLRKIRSGNLQRTTLPQNPGEALTLNFTVDGQNMVMKLYNDYVTYHSYVYSLPNGKQEIQSILSGQ